MNLRDSLMNIIESILQQMSGISQPQKKFLVILFSTILLLYGKVNFTNLSRYSSLSEKTFRRQFIKAFNFPQFNQYFLRCALPEQQVSTSVNPNTLIAVIDCTFLKKSGKKTAGKDYFFNSMAGKAEPGLEISVISVVAVEPKLAYSLTVQQTPKRLEVDPPNKPPKVKGKKTRSSRHKTAAVSSKKSEWTRVDEYIQHLKNTRDFLPSSVRYLVADGYYYRSKFCDAVRDLNLEFIGKLRIDANLRYLYTGEQKKLGAPRKYDGKVDLNDLSRFTFVKEIEPGVSLYTKVVWNCCLNCQIRVVCISETDQNGQRKIALLFSTDVHCNADQILAYYQARFQIEFIFRDAKQFTGLSDCQSPDSQRLDFHFNASLTALNLAKYQAYNCHLSSQPFVFSMASYKRLEFNRHLISTFIDKLDLDRNLILNHPNFPSVLSYGTLVA